MRPAIVLCVAVFLAAAGEDALASPLEDAMAAYRERGLEAFIPTLVKGSPLAGDNSVTEKTAVIRRIESYYGGFDGYEVLEQCRLGSRVRLVLYVMNYKRGPLYGVVTLYGTGKTEIVTRFNFQTDAVKLWQGRGNLPCQESGTR